MEALAPPAPTLVGYLTAAHALPAGTLARDEDFGTRMVAPGEVPKGAFTKGPEVLANIRGALVRHYIEAGAPITLGDILRPRDRGFLAAVLAPGTRAVSIGVDAITGVAGLIWPGDRVDVILTQEMDMATAPLGKRVMSETVLTDIRVIAVDQEIVQGASDTSSVAGKVARTITLQVNQDQAERLTVAQHLGHMALAIRAMIETDEGLVSTSAIYGADVSAALSAFASPAGTHMQVIQGDKRSDVIFQLNSAQMDGSSNVHSNP